MRPDIEDYEELTAGEEAPRSRAMSWLVLVVAVGGFAALAYYAYHSGTSAENGDVLVVQADESTPIKQIPTDPEGEQFANKDKTIYDVITPGSAANSGQGKVEKLLPDPEQPVSVHDMADEDSTNNPEPKASAPTTTTYVNKAVEKATPTVDPVDAQAAKQIAPLTVSPSAPVQTAAPTSEISSTELKPATPVTEAKVAPVVAAPVKGAPTFVNESAASAAKPATKVPAAPAAKAEAKKAAPAAAPAAKGSAAIQLGAFKSEEEAKTTWKKIAGKFSDVLTGSPTIVKADLPNGTFYRLRTTVASAKDACAKLSAKGQACFPVK